MHFPLTDYTNFYTLTTDKMVIYFLILCRRKVCRNPACSQVFAAFFMSINAPSSLNILCSHRYVIAVSPDHFLPPPPPRFLRTNPPQGTSPSISLSLFRVKVTEKAGSVQATPSPSRLGLLGEGVLREGARPSYRGAREGSAQSEGTGPPRARRGGSFMQLGDCARGRVL